MSRGNPLASEGRQVPVTAMLSAQQRRGKDSFERKRELGTAARGHSHRTRGRGRRRNWPGGVVQPARMHRHRTAEKRPARTQAPGMRTRFAPRPVTKRAGQQEPPPGECFEPALEEPRGNEPPETETCSPTPGVPTRSAVARGNSPNATGVRPRPPRLSPQGTHIFRSRFRIELRRLKGL